MTSQERIALVLAEHDDANVDGGYYYCDCGHEFGVVYPNADSMAMHRAAMLAPVITAAQAEALREAAAAAEGMHDPVAPDCQEWADWLRARADNLTT